MAGETCKMLEPERHRRLADALGDRPETVHAVHMLRRGLCRAYVAADEARDPAHFDGALLQPLDWPEEPIGFGSDPATLWQLLQMALGWTCVVVDTELAPALGQIIEAETGRRVRYLDDVYHVLAEPVRVHRADVVRRLTLEDLELLEATPLELRSGLWHSPRELLEEGSIACAIVSGEIAATALMTAITDRYADVGVFTREDYRGRGYATAAASLVAQGIQDDGRIPTWSAGTHNAASMRLAQKLGYREVLRRRYVILAGKG